ncbi:MAG: hypothetical protein ACLVAV_01915 [Clostridium sp.]
MNLGSFKGIAKTRYVNDKQITDHYAIMPTGQGLGNLSGLPPLSEKVYQVSMQPVFKHLLSAGRLPEIQPGAGAHERTVFCQALKVLSEPGYLKVADVNLAKKMQHPGDLLSG